MPTFSPPRTEEEEASQSSKDSSNGAPQSFSQETDNTAGGKEPNAMLGVVMGGESRLMSHQSPETDAGRTSYFSSPSTTPNTTSANQNHVPSSEHAKNDITSHTTSSPSKRTKFTPSSSATEQKPVACCSEGARSTSSPESASTSRTEVQPGAQLLTEIVQATIKLAAKSMARQSEDNTEVLTTTPEDKGEEKMSVDRLFPAKKVKRKRTPQVKPGQSSGRWTEAEHRAFLEGLKQCGREWKKVAMRIPTRTSAQIRSHAQKYFAKLQREHESIALPEGQHSSHAAAIPQEDLVLNFGPSLQRNVERILANPAAIQREVEDTLGALRARYRQLQLRLEQRQRRRVNAIGASFIEDDFSSSSSPRKRRLDDGWNTQGWAAHHDDHSSVSSNVSASELIALQVLGGALPRGDSSTDGALREENKEASDSKSSDTSIASDSMDVEEVAANEGQRKDA